MKADFPHIFNLAIKQNRLAQQHIYDLFAAKLLFVANSYVSNLHDAEDILIEAFYKAFSKIEMCEGPTSFPAWIRKIVVNDAISFIRKKQILLYVDSDFIENAGEKIADDILEQEHDIDIKLLMKTMPAGYKIIFNLVVFEEKKHREIAELLNISEGTSKSQFSKAKKFLADQILQLKKELQNVE